MSIYRRSMKKWPNEYDGFFRLTTAGGEMHMWLEDAEIAQELFYKRAAIYSSCSEVAAVPGSNSQGKYLPLLEPEDHWRRQRKFPHTVPNQAFQNQDYGCVIHEVRRFLYYLMQDPKDHFSQTGRFCGRISARLGRGPPNSAATHCKYAAEFIPQIASSSSGPITTIFPFLGKLPEFINSTKTPCQHRRESEERMFRSLMRGFREKSRQRQGPVSYARTYLSCWLKPEYTTSQEPLIVHPQAAGSSWVWARPKNVSGH